VKSLPKPTVDYLTKKFTQNPRPNKNKLKKIASNAKLNYKQVNIWFLNQRLKQKSNSNSNMKQTKTVLNNTNSSRNFNTKIIKALLNVYNKNKYPDKFLKEKIAAKTGLIKQQVDLWFRKRRYKLNESDLKQKRINFNEKIVKIFLKEYKTNKYPNKSSKERIVNRTGLTIQQVDTWFRKRRYKLNESDKKRKSK